MSGAGKIVAGALLVAAIGLPVIETWESLLLAAGMLFLVFGDATRSWRRYVAAGAAVLAVAAAGAVLPRADIAEAHNAFLVMGDDEPVERGLPPEIFRNWKARFDRLYPPDAEPYAPRSQWRRAGVPAAAYTQSSDAIWRPAKYTRQVDAIDFSSLGDFRGGFANEVQYNFWAGELRRETMPFYVMYELTAASVGSALGWTGQVFWERSDGGFEEVAHAQYATRIIRPQDVGRRVYSVFFPEHEARVFRLEPSWTLSLARWLERLLVVLSAMAVVALTVKPRWRSLAWAMAIFAVACALLSAFVAVSEGKYLGDTYPPHGGGDDGLVHDGWGRAMAMTAGRGDIVEAMRGMESVYWFTPGTRYVRMIEKLIFGDTNHLFALLVAAVPVVVFCLARHFLSARLTGAITAGFLLMPVGHWAFLPYIANAKLGYGDAIACGLFLLGLVLLLRTQPSWGGTDRNPWLIAGGGAALAASMSIRPNFAFAVVWLGIAYTWYAWKRRDARNVAALALGLGLALWLPFHNWYYGGEFYLISKSGATVSVPLGPGDYVAALSDGIRGSFDTSSVAATSAQLAGWLWNPGLIVRPVLAPLARLVQIAQLLALLVTVCVAFRYVAGRLADRPAVGVIAVTAVCAHLPMLFIFTTHYRYAMLGWFLSVFVLIASVSARAARSPVRLPELSPV